MVPLLSFHCGFRMPGPVDWEGRDKVTTLISVQGDDGRGYRRSSVALWGWGGQRLEAS